MIKILIFIYFIILVAEVYLYGTENEYINYSSDIYDLLCHYISIYSKSNNNYDSQCQSPIDFSLVHHLVGFQMNEEAGGVFK